MEDLQKMVQKAMADAEASAKQPKFYCIRGNPDVAPFNTMQAKTVIGIDALFEAEDAGKLIQELTEAAVKQLSGLWAEYKSKLVCVSEEGQ